MQPHLLPDDVPVDPVDEQLVAYLDGELDPAERDALEQRLVDDDALRQRLQQLQGGWELLDELPQSTASEQFTETTLEMVAADLSRDVKQKQASRWQQQWTLPALAALLTLAALIVGAGGVVAVRRWEMQRQLRDLPLAQHLDAYRFADDLDFMRALAARPEWTAHVDTAVKLRQMRFPTTDLQAVPVADRDEKMAALSIRDRERLAFNWREYNRLDDAQRERIRQVAAEVQADPNREQLLRTMDAYGRWYQGLDKETQTALRESSGEQRDELMRLAMEKSRREWITRSGPLLNDDDVEAIYDVMHTVAGDWIDMIKRDESALPDRDHEVLDRRINNYADLYNQPTPEAAVLDYLVVWRNAVRTNFTPTESYGSSGQETLNALFRLSELQYWALESVLSAEAQEKLEAALAQELQRDLLDQWIYEAVLRTTGGARATLPRSERLMAMDPEQREELELSPPSTIFGRLDRGPRGFGSSMSGRTPGGPSGRSFRGGGPPPPPAGPPPAAPPPADPPTADDAAAPPATAPDADRAN